MITHTFTIDVTVATGQRYCWNVTASTWASAYDAMCVAHPDYIGFSIMCDRTATNAPTVIGD